MKRLTAAGLNDDEAEGLIATWEEGLFKQEGLTVLYRVAQATYDRWLPLEAKPKPTSIVRVGLVLHRHLEPEFDAKVNMLIEKLGSEEFDTRNAAKQALMKIGGAAFELLKKHGNHSDPEIAGACQHILHALDARSVLKPAKSSK